MLFWLLIWVGVICAFGILNIWYMHTNAYNNLQLSMKRYQNMEDRLEFVNIGSGPSYYAFDYQDAQLRGFNFASAPQSVYHDYALLNHYKEKIASNAIVIVTITCPLSFCQNKFHESKDYRCKYYGVLDSSEVDGGTGLEAFMYKHFPLVLYPKRVIRIIRDVPRNSTYVEQVASLKEDAEEMLKGWSINNGVQNLMDETQALSHQVEFNKKIKVYTKILQLCKEQEWRAYFVIPPVSKPIRDMLSPEFKQRFLLDNIQQANIANVPVLDYSNDERMLDDKYYLNSMFLNEMGRKKFQEIIWKDLRRYG